MPAQTGKHKRDLRLSGMPSKFSCVRDSIMRIVLKFLSKAV